jgi:hypothetical protein
MGKMEVSFKVTEDGQINLESESFHGDPLTRQQSRDLAMRVLVQQGADGADAARRVLAALDERPKVGA